jgi:hypothetical protein
MRALAMKGRTADNVVDEHAGGRPHMEDASLCRAWRVCLGKIPFKPENARRPADISERLCAENIDFRFAPGTSATLSMSAAAATFFTARAASRCIRSRVCPRIRVVTL